MRAIKTGLISIIALGLLAGSAVGVAPQDEEAAGPMAPVFFSWTIDQASEPEFVEGAVDASVPGVTTARGNTVTGVRIEAEDPRASGVSTIFLNEDIYDVAATGEIIGVTTIARRITNDDGSWSGTGNEAIYLDTAADAPPTGVQFATLTGEGGYEGLTLILFEFRGEQLGWIVPTGDVPPIPELPAE